MTNAIEKAKQTTLAQYGSFDVEEMEKTAAALPTGGGNFFKPRQGKNVVRLLPPPVGKQPWFVWHKHFFSLGQERKNIICAKYQYEEPCAVCQTGQKLRASGNKLDSDKARAYEPTSQVYMNVVDMLEPEKGVQLWTLTPVGFKAVKDAIDLSQVKNVADPVNGFNILFKRTGEGLQTRYTGWVVARQSTPLPGWEELLPQQIDLSNSEQAPSDEEQEEAADGQYEDRSFKKKERSERDVTPRGGARSAGAAKAESLDYDDDVPL